MEADCTMLADIENSADTARLMGGHSGIVVTSLAAKESIGRLGGIAFVENGLSVKAENAALFNHNRILGVLQNEDLGVLFSNVLGEGEKAGLVNARIYNGGHIAAFNADMRLQEVKAGDDERQG